eukprot:3940461-Rhodomonas_salina.4
MKLSPELLDPVPSSEHPGDQHDILAQYQAWCGTLTVGADTRDQDTTVASSSTPSGVWVSMDILIGERSDRRYLPTRVLCHARYWHALDGMHGTHIAHCDVRCAMCDVRCAMCDVRCAMCGTDVTLPPPPPPPNPIARRCALRYTALTSRMVIPSSLSSQRDAARVARTLGIASYPISYARATQCPVLAYAFAM